ncbi:MAG: hypothetical protein KBC81_01735 [Candidatus Pacebacteria bacterium]|nr:hypothetical protein [Candidatus Paceibacterota bacterium]
MKRFAIILIWIAVVVADGVLLPAISGMPSGFGALVFLSALIITFHVHRWVIGLGIFISLATELWVGAYFGTIIGSYLIMVIVWYLLNKFLNMRSASENGSMLAIIPFTFLGIILFGVGEVFLWLVNRYVYIRDLSMATLIKLIISPEILAIVTIELIVIFLVFNFIYSSQND